jgi:hypothetical protein
MKNGTIRDLCDSGKRDTKILKNMQKTHTNLTSPPQKQAMKFFFNSTSNLLLRVRSPADLTISYENESIIFILFACGI